MFNEVGIQYFIGNMKRFIHVNQKYKTFCTLSD